MVLEGDAARAKGELLNIDSADGVVKVGLLPRWLWFFSICIFLIHFFLGPCFHPPCFPAVRPTSAAHFAHVNAGQAAPLLCVILKFVKYKFARLEIYLSISHTRYKKKTSPKSSTQSQSIASSHVSFQTQCQSKNAEVDLRKTPVAALLCLWKE